MSRIVKENSTNSAEIMIKPNGAKKKHADIDILRNAKVELKRLGQAYIEHPWPQIGLNSSILHVLSSKSS